MCGRRDLAGRCARHLWTGGAGGDSGPVLSFFFSDAAPHASRDKKKKKASLCPVADDSSGLTAFDKFTRDLASAMAIARL